MPAAVYASIALRTGHDRSSGGNEGRPGMRMSERLDVDRVPSGRSTRTGTSSSATSSPGTAVRAGPRPLDEFDRARETASCSRAEGSSAATSTASPASRRGSSGTRSPSTGSSTSFAIRPDIVDSVRATLNFNLPGSVAQHYHTDGLYTEGVPDLQHRRRRHRPRERRDRRPPRHEPGVLQVLAVRLERKYRLTTRVPLRAGRRRRPQVDAVAPRHAEPTAPPRGR